VLTLERRWRRVLAGCVAAGWLAAGWWGSHKSLPAGAHVASALADLPADEVSFIADITAADAYGRPVVSQAIFDQLLEVLRGARVFVVLDYALIGGTPAAGAPARGAQLQDALLERRRALPALKLLLITDQASDAADAAALPLLRSAGVEVVVTDTGVLRAATLVYTGPWRRTADHRKLIIADDGHGGLTGIVGSANPQDEQGLWSNAALRVRGEPLEALLASELALARSSGWRGEAALFGTAAPGSAAAPDSAAAPAGAAGAQSASRPTARLQSLTEGAILSALLERLEAASPGDAIDVAAFKLADRAVLEALLAAASRGVSVRVLLDPGEQTQGLLSGIPNQPVASELQARSAGAVQVRWYRTHGERFHTSLVAIYGQDRLWFTVGSANLTRRSLGDYNLEANIAVEVARATPLAAQLLRYYDTLWGNRAALGIEYSADFAVFADPSPAGYLVGRVMEASGLSAY
jgi:phosphatidylserine/phosphatidylglycerophosphate/cardiolipin synthase-like enzyme